MMVHCLHKLLHTNFILEQIWKMDRVLSPLLSTNRNQFKTLQYPDIKSTNDNLYHDTTFVLSEDHWNKLEHLKWLCPSDNNSIFIREQPRLLQRAITQTENKILQHFLLIDWRLHVTLEIHRHCLFRTSTRILMGHCSHKLFDANFICEQICKMGAELSPPFSTNRHHLKTRILKVRIITFKRISLLSFRKKVVLNF